MAKASFEVAMKVRKASGRLEDFSGEKVKNSLLRAGANHELANKILAHLEGELFDGITTREIYSHVFSLLKKWESPLASKYNLKAAIMQLGPAGYPFEQFVASILHHLGYEVEVGQIVKGKCVAHEVDIIARKDGEYSFIETKFHNKAGTKSDIKTALYVWARFLDVSGQDAKFKKGWLVTNTKATTQAIEYANCVRLKIVSWDYPEEGSLRYLIEKSKLHPITCLRTLKEREKKGLLNNGIVFCKDLVKTSVSPQILEELSKLYG